MPKTLVVFISALLSSCATVLTSEGQKIVKVDAVSYSCVTQKDWVVKHRASSNCNSAQEIEVRLRNAAASEGATHILVREIRACAVDATIYKCPATFGLTNESLKPMCDAGNGDACADMGFNLAKMGSEDFEVREALYRKGCDQGNSVGACTALRTLLSQKKTRDSIQKCEAANQSAACLEVSSEYHSHNELDDAIRYAGLACSKGSQIGCEMQKSIADERQRRSELRAMQKQLEDEQQAWEAGQQRIRSQQYNRDMQHASELMGATPKGEMGGSSVSGGGFSAPFCVQTSYGTNCFYHGAAECRKAASESNGMCIPNPNR